MQESSGRQAHGLVDSGRFNPQTESRREGFGLSTHCPFLRLASRIGQG